MTPSDLLRRIFHPASERTQGQSGLDVVGNTKAKVQASYVSGNPTIQLPHETSTTAGPKTHKVIQYAGNRNAALVANDPIAVIVDRNNNRSVAGKYVDADSGITDADFFMGLEVAAPGNTVLQSANTEESTTSATYVKKKEFYDARPGKFRLAFELARTGGTVQAIIQIRLADGSYIDASAVATLATTTYPTFTTKTLDMTVDTGLGASVIAVYILNSLGPAQTSYIRNAQLKYQRATASLSPYGVVLLD